MPQLPLTIPEFRSLEEFRSWYESAKVNEFCRLNPDKVSQLQQHPLVSPWWQKLSGQLKTQIAGDAGAPEKPLISARVLGKYLIGRKLGQGGMGEVYLAQDQILKRQVAVKVMDSDDNESIERFLREARSIARLKHPNIIQIYDIGSQENYHYFAMEYISGGSLETLINEKNLSHQQAAEIIADIAAALAYAHSHSVIHRDLKPSNIMLDSGGRVCLMDFGLAKETTGLEKSLTLSGAIMGTPDYMSPEQARGDKPAIDQQSDIFSLGATLYHALTGQLPFQGKELYEVLAKVINHDPAPPSRLAGGLPRDLEIICLKCLAKEKPHRYRTAQELSDDLRRFLSGQPILARPAGFSVLLWKKIRQNKAASLSISGAVLALLVVAGFLWVKSVEKQRQVETYRGQIKQALDRADHESALAAANKLLALEPDDTRTLEIARQSRNVIKDKEDRLLAEKAKSEEEIQRTRQAKERRERAKIKLDRAESTTSPEQRIKIAREALFIDPSYGDAYQLIGANYFTLGKYDQCLEAMNKAIELSPNLAYAYHYRAMVKADAYNKPDEAIEDFRKVLELDPTSHIGWLAKGSVEFHQKQYEEARASLTRAISIYPKYDLAYNWRGMVQLALNDYDLAIDDYNRAIELNPNYAASYINRGCVYAKQGFWKKAWVDFNKAIEVDKTSALAYRNRGFADMALEEYTRALADYSQAIKLRPQYLEAYLGRVEASLQLGKIEHAMEDCNVAIHIKPDYARAYISRGAVWQQKGKLDNALADYDQAVKLDPADAQAWLSRGVVNDQMGQTDKAIADFTQALKLAPKYDSAYYSRGRTYYMLKRWDMAIADYTQALQISPYDLMARLGRGSAYLYNNQIPEAVSDLTKVIKLEPKMFHTYYFRAEAYAKQGDYRKAVSDGENFLKFWDGKKNQYEPLVRELLPKWKEQIKE